MQVNRLDCDVAPDEPAIAEQEIMAELERILSAPEFRSTERNRKFLRYVTEQMLQGREDKVKAYSIAVDVVGRPANFDPVIDPIVRIEATRLRASRSPASWSRPWAATRNCTGSTWDGRKP